jgi:hypothetical protein
LGYSQFPPAKKHDSAGGGITDLPRQRVLKNLAVPTDHFREVCQHSVRILEASLANDQDGDGVVSQRIPEFPSVFVSRPNDATPIRG